MLELRFGLKIVVIILGFAFCVMAANGQRLAQWGISEQFTVNKAQMLIDALHLI